MTCDWELSVKMSYYKKDLEKNKPIFENICYEMAAMIGGSVDRINLEDGTCLISAEAKIQTDLESWWDSIFEDCSDLDNSVGIQASGNGTIVWRYKNGECTYCAWDGDVIVDVAQGIMP